MTGFEAACAAYDSEMPPYLEDEDDDVDYIHEYCESSTPIDERGYVTPCALADKHEGLCSWQVQQ